MEIVRPQVRLTELVNALPATWDSIQAGFDAITASFASMFYNVKDYGLVGDGTTDDTAALQALLDLIGTSDLDSTIFFPVGVYKIAGSLADTGASNCQLVLPKRNTLADQITIRLLGAVPGPTFGRGNGGAIIQSTLTSGTGAILGVKNTSSSGGIGDIIDGANFLVVHIENLTFRAKDNPTISGIDLRYCPSIALRNVKVDVDFTTIPSQPTTTTSYGIRTSLNDIAAVAVLDNVQVTGFYNGYQWGELCSGNNVTANFCVYVAEIPEAKHALAFQRVLRTECIHGLKPTGGSSTIFIQQFDVDNNTAVGAWYNFVDHISDPDNLLHGIIYWHTVTQDVGAGNVWTEDGAFYLWSEQLGNLETAGSGASPFVQCHNTANISIANNTLPSAGVGNVTFDTNLSSDRYGLHSTSSNTDRLVCKKKGLVHITFGASFATNTTGRRQVRIYKHSPSGGGVEIALSIQNFNPVTGDPTTIQASIEAGSTLPGDYFYIVVYQDSGGSLNLLTSNYNSPYMTFRISR